MKPSTAALAALLLLLTASAARGDNTTTSGAPTELDIECSDLMPGCVDCHQVGSSAGRRLRGLIADTVQQLTTAAQSGFDYKPYTQPANFYCDACNKTEGYKLNTKLGRCGEPATLRARFAGWVRGEEGKGAGVCAGSAAWGAGRAQRVCLRRVRTHASATAARRTGPARRVPRAAPHAL